MLYMVIERFKEGAAPEIYRRFRDKGRMMPDGLEYVSSWIDVDLKICYQLMQAEDASLFPLWTDNWNDLMDFEIVPVRTSAETVELMPRNPPLLLVQRNAGTDPGFVFVEIDAHHFALAHAHEIVRECGLAVILRPNTHHPEFRF